MPKKRDYRSIDRYLLWARYDGQCGICLEPLLFEQMTIDHIIPLSRGGSNKEKNLQPAHEECNRLKDNLMPWEEPKPKKHKKLAYRNWPCYTR